jgi:predicted NAD/FAD-dependent oxidoreductase
VTLLDKGRSAGGRLATRRVGAARLDHGAQFFTVRTEEFARLAQPWQADGLVREWCRGFGPVGDGHPRYAVTGGMNALAKHLAQGLDVRCNQLVFAVRPGAGRWEVGLDDASVVEADALVVTCPLPQASAVLVTSGVELPRELRETEYDRTLSILVALDRPGAVPEPGGVQHPNDVFGFIGDNVSKGVSDHPAITFHASAGWSEAHWDDEREAVTAALLEHARPWLGDAQVLEVSPKRWRFATPRSIWPEPCWFHDGGAAPLVVAGDAFAGPRVEGAALSGLAAAGALLA